MKLRPSLLFLSLGVAGLLCAASPLRAQDDQQSLGDVAKKNRAAKPKAKVTRDEDNSTAAKPASDSASAASTSAEAGAQTGNTNDQPQSTAQVAPNAAATSPASPGDAMTGLKKDEQELRDVIKRLQDKINSDQGTDEAKQAWRDAVKHAQQQLDDNLKQQGNAPQPAAAQPQP